MPEYLAPGVYVEETSFRSKSIEGVSTTTTGFVGPTLYGPIDGAPDLVTSLVEFERLYGGGRPIRFADDATTTVDPAADGSLASVETRATPNDVWQAVRAFFDNGGARLYVQRIYRGVREEVAGGVPEGEEPPRYDGRAQALIASGGGGQGLRIQARYPGVAGARTVRLTLEVGRNRLLAQDLPERVRRLNGVTDRDVVLVQRGGPSGEQFFALARRDETQAGAAAWRFEGGVADASPFDSPVARGDDVALDSLGPGDSVRVVTLAVTDLPDGPDGEQGVALAGLPLDPGHRRGDVPDSVFDRFSDDPPRRSDLSDLPIVIELEEGGSPAGVDGLEVLGRLLAEAEVRPDPSGHDNPMSPVSPVGDSWLARALLGEPVDPALRSYEVVLEGGLDGVRPTASDYAGRTDERNRKSGLLALEDIEDISIVAAPGSTRHYAEADWQPQADATISALIAHCERMRYRIAVLDSGDGQTIASVRDMRGRIDSSHAALYYPWVTIVDPITQREIELPPSGFVAGIYARNDRLRAVYKAPANEVVSGAIRFERLINRSQQEVLNPEGVNCFRFFEGRGYRLWGARTASSDPEWKYVNLRRYFAYLERSIDVGTQWAVFEPNGERLWANVRRTIEDFLFNEFQMGALLGEKPEKAYFVRCDRSTMTQNDLDNGRLVCLVGVAALRPAEFVIFRIGQWTADRRA